MATWRSTPRFALIVYDSGYSDPGLELKMTENSSALEERLSCPGGGVTKLFTLSDFQTVLPVLGLCHLQVNWIVGNHTLGCVCERMKRVEIDGTYPTDE